MRRRTLVGSGALLIALAAPAAAHALPTIQPLKPCYVTADTEEGPESEGVQITAAGFTPNSSVDLTIDGAPFPGGDDLQTDAAGGLPIEPVPAPFVAAGSRTFTITLTEVGNPANTVSATARSTALGVEVEPLWAEPSHRILFTGLGFTEDMAIYAHYLHRRAFRKGVPRKSKRRLRKTVRVARRPGACGSFKARRRQIPIRRPRLGKWILQFDQSKRFVDPNVTPIVFVRLAIKIRLVPESRPRRRCDSNYAGACLKPNVSDYDCAGGGGDGPYYTGPVRVVGDDHYRLDPDGDAVACKT